MKSESISNGKMRKKTWKTLSKLSSSPQCLAMETHYSRNAFYAKLHAFSRVTIYSPVTGKKKDLGSATVAFVEEMSTFYSQKMRVNSPWPQAVLTNLWYFLILLWELQGWYWKWSSVLLISSQAPQWRAAALMLCQVLMEALKSGMFLTHLRRDDLILHAWQLPEVSQRYNWLNHSSRILVLSRRHRDFSKISYQDVNKDFSYVVHQNQVLKYFLLQIL